MVNQNNSNTISTLLLGKGIPDYNKITSKEVRKDIPILILDLNKSLSKLEGSIENILDNNDILTWGNIMDPLYKLSEKLRWSWGVVTHLNGVCNSNEFRKAHAEQQPEIIHFTNRLGQSQTIYRALYKLKETSLNNLNHTQIRILDSTLLSMDQRGVGLDDKTKEDFNNDSARLAEISTLFSNNVLDATNNWSILLDDKLDVEGLPKRALEILALSAKKTGDFNKKTNSEPNAEQGPWRLGLDMPRYIPFITYSNNRALREKIYRAYVSRASVGEQNNQDLIDEILTIRKRQAQRLGYENWAEVSLANKMAKNVCEVEQLLDELRKAAYPAAIKEIEALKDCAKRNGKIETAKEFAVKTFTFQQSIIQLSASS